MQGVLTILDQIGNTPLVRLSRITRSVKANISVKLEYLNPSGSLKDRIALRMIEQAEEEGSLRPGHTIVESSTGNTGIALSFVGRVKGYRVLIYETIPGKMDDEKVKMMRSYGAEVELLTPKADADDKSVAGAEVESPGRRICLELERNNSNVWWARQFSNPQNVGAHKTTAREILSQLDGNVDCFVASIGTGGTLMGIAEVLRKDCPNIRIVGIQPASSKIPMIPGKPYPRSEIAGGIICDMLEKPYLIDEIVRVSDEDAVAMTHRLWREEGLFAGVSSGANVLVALKEAKRLGERKNVVTILPDSGDRYLSTEHYVT
jgi:cysteine synthase A